MRKAPQFAARARAVASRARSRSRRPTCAARSSSQTTAIELHPVTGQPRARTRSKPPSKSARRRRIPRWPGPQTRGAGDRGDAGRVASEGPRARPRPPPPDLRRGPAGPRTWPPKAPPGTSRAPGWGRPARARVRRRAVAGSRRCHAAMRTQSAHAADAREHARGRPRRCLTPRSPGDRGHRRGRRTGTSPPQRPGRAGRGARVRARARPRARGRPPRPRNPHAPGPGRRNAPIPKRRPHRGPTSPAPGARRAGRGRFVDLSPPRARGGPRAARPRRMPGRSPSEPEGGGTPRAGRGPTSPPIRRCSRPTPECRAARLRATPASDRRPGLPLLRAASGAHPQEALPAVAQSSPRRRPKRAWPEPNQIRPRAGSDSTRGGAPTGPAGSRGSRQRSAPGHVHPAERARPTPAAPVHHDDPRVQRLAPADRSAPRRALVLRTRARSSPPTDGAPQRQGSPRTRCRAIARHR